jgi:hypothetical protein
MTHKRTDPWIPVGHPDFKWTSDADVQALWRKYGWVSPSEQRPAPPIIEESEWQARKQLRRMK